MIPKNRYRLDEYRISEFADNRLWWDTHSGLGTQVGGPCFLFGSLLIMGNRCAAENGFLKLEFIGNLKGLPMWDRTRHYCFASDLLAVASGRRIDQDILPQMAASHKLTHSSSPDTDEESPGSFRLGHYQLTIHSGGGISWKRCAGPRQVIGGTAVIVSDVLFIGPRQVDYPDQDKREFHHALRALPKWEKTSFWCRSLALKPVLPGAQSITRPPPQKTKPPRQQKRMPAKRDQSQSAKQAWTKMTDHCSHWVKGVQAAWSHRVWRKGTRKRDIGKDPF